MSYQKLYLAKQHRQTTPLTNQLHPNSSYKTITAPNVYESPPNFYSLIRRIN